MHKEVEEKPLRAVMAAVQLPNVGDAEFEASLAELRELAKTLGFKVVRTFTQRRSGFDRTGYLGVGKRQEIHAFVNGELGAAVPLEELPTGPGEEAAEERSAAAVLGRARGDIAGDPGGDIEVILVDHEISPSQLRNLELEGGCEVMDRTMVILEIFHRNARSPAAKAQVEIARLGYMAPRLREAAKLAGPQGRQRSGMGGRGAGESHTELDRRKIRDRMAELQEEIVAMNATRDTQRARRQERQGGLAGVALVGYTNAGKSTLMRALTGSEVLVANKLFATLDTTVRALHPETVPRVLVSDTVGFIKNLPHGLVASFKSTLDEALDAELLLHVIDASDPGFERQREVTDKVLAEIDADQVPRLRVFNKIDHVGSGETAAAEQAELTLRLLEEYPDCVVMSARRPEDVAHLHQIIVSFFQKDLVEAELFLPWSAQQFRKDVYANCQVLEERADEAGAHFRVKGEPLAVERLREELAALA
ncbi:GTPase HflX [Niveibacterium sp. SC-1]|uniref:GTPase HflX n=1 Tax=Niveibacterium sp. SC-1 TaxID=3135646 RepID=UPI00311E47B4